MFLQFALGTKHLRMMVVFNMGQFTTVNCLTMSISEDGLPMQCAHNDMIGILHPVVVLQVLQW